MFSGVYVKYLLDTHTLLWYLLDDSKLSKNAHHLIDIEECYYSRVSLWEIAIKQSLGKLQYSKSIPEIVKMCQDEEFENLPVNDLNLEQLKTLEFIHNDPFDRLLISQAINNNMTIITCDDKIPLYDVKTVW